MLKVNLILFINMLLHKKNESIYWLELLYETSYLNIEEYNSIYANAEELMKLLTTSIKTAKSHC